MIARRMAAAVTALLAGAGLGVCGSAARAETRRAEPAAIARAAVARTAAVAAVGGTAAVAAVGGTSAVRPVARDARAVVRAGAGVRNVPPAFRLPPGSHVADLSDRASGASFTLIAPDPAAVLAFFRRELPRAAFTIVADRAEGDATNLAFRDADGWAGAVFATAHRVTVAVKRA